MTMMGHKTRQSESYPAIPDHFWKKCRWQAASCYVLRIGCTHCHWWESVMVFVCFSSHVMLRHVGASLLPRPGRDCKLSFSSRISVSLDLNVMDIKRQITVGISSLTCAFIQTGSKRNLQSNQAFLRSKPTLHVLVAWKPDSPTQECKRMSRALRSVPDMTLWCLMLHAGSYYHLLVAMWYDAKPNHWEHSES